MNNINHDGTDNIKNQPQQKLTEAMIFFEPDGESSESEKILPSVIQQNLNKISADDKKHEIDNKVQPQQELIEPMVFFETNEKDSSELMVSFPKTSEKPIEDKSNVENTFALKLPVSKSQVNIT